MDRDELIEILNVFEPGDYTDWSIEELQELLINLGISII